MTDTTTTDTDAPLTLDFEPDPDLHPEAVDVLSVYYGVTIALELVADSLDEGNPPEELDQVTVDTLEHAFQVGERLRDHHAYEQFCESGLNALPDALAGDVYQTFGPIAPIVGIELSPPGGVETGAEPTANR